MTNSPNALPPCSVLLLCGGRGQRMGGQDKGLLPWRGRPLVAWLADVAHLISDDVLISCNRNADHYAPYATHTLHDDCTDFSGPLAGIRRGLAHCRYESLLVLPCDAPKISIDILNALRECSAAHQHQAVMVQQGEQWQPLISLWPRTALPALTHAWQCGERSPLSFLINQRAHAVHYPSHDDRFVNLNTPEQLDALAH